MKVGDKVTLSEYEIWKCTSKTEICGKLFDIRAALRASQGVVLEVVQHEKRVCVLWEGKARSWEAFDNLELVE